jgi:hypothetical protein
MVAAIAWCEADRPVGVVVRICGLGDLTCRQEIEC